MKPYITLSKSVLFKNPYWRYGCDRVEFPSGKKGDYHYVISNGSSMVVAVDDTGRILLVRQYRYTGNRDSLELPCGGVKDGATHDETAMEELREETGFIPGQIQAIGEFNPCNGLLDEICRVYIAVNLRYAGTTPDETESFELVRLTPQEIDAYIADGAIWDGMTLAAWIIAKHHLP
ncbi:MAG: NUDIX hydrolase [Acidobacteria bacterium]|nr:NUDIX hydrolase [Acidobacteriota bacterium]